MDLRYRDPLGQGRQHKGKGGKEREQKGGNRKEGKEDGEGERKGKVPAALVFPLPALLRDVCV